MGKLIDKLKEFGKYAAERDRQNKEKKEKEKEANRIAKCKKCGCESLSMHKKGYGMIKGLTGGILTLGNPVGLVAGCIGKNKMKVYCMNCGYSWKV